MQHSFRSVSLTPDPSGDARRSADGRDLPHQDRASGRNRREGTARHGAVQIEDDEQPRGAESYPNDEGRRPAPSTRAGRRSRQEPVDSLFSPESPPPLEAPEGVAELTGWELAAVMWRDHLPEALMGVDCASCNQSWPCDGWNLANDLLTQCCEGARQTELGSPTQS